MGNVSSQTAAMPAAAGTYTATSGSTQDSFSSGPATFAGSATTSAAEAGTDGIADEGPAAAAAGIDAGTPAGRHRKRLLQLEAKLQRYMDSEDRRVKELTEGVLYELLPAALNVMLPNCEDPLQELDEERCRAVAGAALAVSSLMNAPPGFLEFLLCIPWRQLPLLYPASKASAGQQTPEQLLAQLAVDESERKLLVNMRIHPQLMRPLLEFLYKPEHADSVPPLLRPQAAAAEQQQSQQAAGMSATTETAGGQSATAAGRTAGSPATTGAADLELLDAVAALLDGATPLHCAALRGNPAQIDHLLYCGADPTLRTAAGELALELLPVCGRITKETGKRQCLCLGPVEQEVWECRSRIARNLIARHCLLAFRMGLFSFLSLAWLCLLALVGLVTNNTSLQRPTLQAHVQQRRQQRLADAHAGVCSLLDHMRHEASQGHKYLTAVKHKVGYRQHTAEPPQASYSSSSSSSRPAVSTCYATGSAGGAPDVGAVTDMSTREHERTPQQQLKPSLNASVLGATSSDTCVDVELEYPDSSGGILVDPVAPATPSAAAEAAATQSGSKDFPEDMFGSPAALTANSEGLHQEGYHQQQQQASSEHIPDAPLQCIHSVDGETPRSSRCSRETANEIQPQPCDPLDKDSATELAFKCYVRAVHALQSLDLQGGVLPHVLAGHPDAFAASSSQLIAASAATAADVDVQQTVAEPPLAGEEATAASVGSQSAGHQQLLVLEDEQAALYCCWAESVLLKFNSCSCPGCTALAVQAIRMAHIAAARLLGRMHKLRKQCPQRWRAVGQALSRVVYAHIALLCQTEARAPPSKASLWRAQQCLQEWDRLAAAGLVGQEQEGPGDTQLVNALRMWAKTAESDLLIAEALLGCSLGPVTTLAEALSAALLPPPAQPSDNSSSEGCNAAAPSGQGGSSTSCEPVLARPVSAALLDQLQAARGLATCTSPAVKQLAAQVAEATARELSAGARLKQLLAARTTPSTNEGVAALAAAIAAAEPFSSLAADVAAARSLHEQCCHRVEAAAKLQAVVDQVIQQTGHVTSISCSAWSGNSTSVGSGSGAAAAAGSSRDASAAAAGAAGALNLQGFEVAEWESYVAMLEAAVEEAKDANVSVIKARKLVKELQAQLAAADAAAALDACMARRPCGSAALRAAISKAEPAASAVAGAAVAPASSSSGSGGSSGITAAHGGGSSGVSTGSSCAVFSEVLLMRLQAAKKRLEVERASEVLHKASVVYKSLADLPKLEAAILNARKVGAEELAPDEYKAASELRARLTSAAKVKQQLDTALRSLAATAAAEAAEPVEAAIKEAARWEDLLPGEATRAAEALDTWRTSSACEAKLNMALRDGSSTAQLSRLITEAAAAGVKVAAARRILKLQQALEVAIAAADEACGASSSQYGQLAAKLEAAEQGGVALVVLEPGKKLLKKLLACEAREALEAALKPHSDWSANMRIASLRVALDKAEDVLGWDIPDLLKQQHQKQQEEGQHTEQQQQQEDDAVQLQEPEQQQPADYIALSASEQPTSAPDTGTQPTSAPDTGTQPTSAPDTGTQPTSAPDTGTATDGKSDNTVGDTTAVTVRATAGQEKHQERQAAGGLSCANLSKTSSMHRTDSMASSVAASDVSASTAAGVASILLGLGSSCRGPPGGTAAGSDEVVCAVAELAVRAWQLYEQHQKQLQEIDRERAEQERARRELKERERQERARAEAERAERGKQERERAAAERRIARAKAAAERSKGLAVVWGSSAAGAASAVNGSRSGVSASVASKKEMSPSSINSSVRTSSTSGDAAHSRPSTPVNSSSAQQQRQEGAAIPSPRPATAPVTPGAAVNNAVGAVLAAEHTPDDTEHDPADTPLHVRSDSYDLTSKVLAMLGPDLHDEQQPSTMGLGPCQQQQCKPRPSLECTVSASGSSSAAVSGGGLEGLDLAGVQWQRQQQQAAGWMLRTAALDTMLPAGQDTGGQQQQQQGYGFRDLGGVSWGQPSPTAAGASSNLTGDLRGSADGQGPIAAAVGSSTGSAGGGGSIWGSALGLGVADSSATLPPLVHQKGQQQQQQRLVRLQRSTTDDGNSGAAAANPGSTVGSRQLAQHLSLNNVEHAAAGRVSPVLRPPGAVSDAASNLYGFGQQPQHGLMLVQGQGLLVGHHQALQQQHNAGLRQAPIGSGNLSGDHAAYSAAAGVLALLSRPASSSNSSSPAVLGARLGMAGSGMPGWTAAQQQHLTAQSGHGFVAAAAAAAAAAARSGVGPGIAGSGDSLHAFGLSANALQQQQQVQCAKYLQAQQQQQLQLLQFQQLQQQLHHQHHQQQQLQLQLQQEQQQAAVLTGSGILGQPGAYAGSALTGMSSGVQVSAAAVGGSGPPMLLPTSSSGISNSLLGQGVGQFSSSFAFGAPGLSAFSQGPAPCGASSGGGSSGAGVLGGRASEPGGARSLDGAASEDAADVQQRLARSSSDGQRQVAPEFDAVSRLPDDLGLSPP